MRDRIRNVDLLRKLGIADIEDKTRENLSQWFRHVRRQPQDAPLRKVENWGNGDLKRSR